MKRLLLAVFLVSLTAFSPAEQQQDELTCQGYFMGQRATVKNHTLPLFSGGEYDFSSSALPLVKPARCYGLGTRYPCDQTNPQRR